jgi:hypothetical protein
MLERIPNPYINVGAIDVNINEIHITIGKIPKSEIILPSTFYLVIRNS